MSTYTYPKFPEGVDLAYTYGGPLYMTPEQYKDYLINLVKEDIKKEILEELRNNK